MTVEIRNYDTSKATKSFQGSFDLIIRSWQLMIKDCKLFQSGDKKWIQLPSRAVKNGDGSWGQPIPYIEFINREQFYKLQSLAIAELTKKLEPEPPQQLTDEYYPHGLVKRTEEFQS